MLEHTFCHLPGIDIQEEKRYWEKGILTWEDLRGHYLELAKSSEDTYPKLLLDSLEFSRRELERKNWSYFFFALPNRQKWRLFPRIREKILYLDIETSGLSREDFVTVVGSYDGQQFKEFLRGRNMDDFLGYLDPQHILVSYNGVAFDIPFLEKEFGQKFRNLHYDLMHMLHGLGFKGGLKNCEKALGITRDLPFEVNGSDAVRLWWQYVQYDDQEALSLLLKYNREDVKNLELIFIKCYNLNIRNTPFYGEIISENVNQI
ncbi:exonuclease [Leptospira perolatii]|uniref:Exonuclease n=1 Tax=Leptospira perolatii TaxID=2023191 RepID=A0A2M9ZTA2_9LEPT|nr:ribonuclease H-like domain-containing protein [Leptospira perolatii]PJZ68788.1 exonuclease [Leptospira perolatii]PJZ75143.1 exonuclease [Leptospira perolatii]